MRLAAALLAAIALVACQPPAPATDNDASAIDNVAEAAPANEAVSVNQDAGSAEELAAPDVAPVEAAPIEPASLCWQDYCPCDPPQGGMDQMLCRRLRAGLPVDDEMMSAGAGFRDARRQMEELERRPPESFEL